MTKDCGGDESAKKRSRELPVLAAAPSKKPDGRTTSFWRAAVLIGINVLMILHVLQWKFGGSTISPIEPSETMATLQRGAVNAGFIFFTLAILATLVFGRFVCGWGCHMIALQDFCAWLMGKFGLRPRPFRSRLLVFVPLLVALYMFVWPTVTRWLVKPPEETLFPAFTNHIITTDFWATFPTIAVAIPFLFVCGFMTVYFLGSKGFCTYACPYGGFFAVADRLSPGRIRVTDACHECGQCTAACTSNVLVHAEVKKYGMVVDQGCMKCMDCVGACPNDALYFGFGKPSLATPAAERKYSLTWPEEILAALVFAASYLAVWDVYQLVPMLMALGLASVSTFLFVRLLQVVRAGDAAMFKYALKSGGKWRRAGLVFAGFAVLWTAFVVHTGWVHFNEANGNVAYAGIRLPDELALAKRNPDSWLTPTDRSSAVLTVSYLDRARKVSIFENDATLPKLAWAKFLTGDAERAVQLLSEDAARKEGEAKALSLYYRGAILSRLGRFEESIASLDASLAVRPDLVLAREERGEALWRLGRKEDAVAEWRRALDQNPSLALTNNFLAGAAADAGRAEDAAEFQKLADGAAPNEATYFWMLGQRLQNAGFYALAEKQFQHAMKINPQFKSVKR